MEPSKTLQPLEEGTPQTAVVPLVADVPRSQPAALVPTRPGMWESVRDAWRARYLFAPLSARGLAKRVQGTILGNTWLALRPLMDAVGKTLLFGGILKVSSGSDTPYFLFLLSGMVGWRLFERSMRYSARSFLQYKKMAMTFYFPLLLVPLAGIAYPLLDVAIYWLVFFGAVGVFWAIDGKLYLEPPPEILMVVPGLVLLFVITYALSMWISVLNAKARDVRQVLRYVMPVGLIVTPVLYPPSQLGDYAWIMIINPLTAPIELIRDGLVGNVDVHPEAIVWSIVFGVILFGSGLWFFCREAARSIEGMTGGDDDDDEEDGGL